MKVRIVVIVNGKQTVLDLDKPMVMIGRRGCDVELNDPLISRRHAVLVQTEDGRLRIKDLGSMNGTLVEGKRVVLQTIGVGTQIEVGDAVIGILAYEPVGTPANGAIVLGAEQYYDRGLLRRA